MDQIQEKQRNVEQHLIAFNPDIVKEFYDRTEGKKTGLKELKKFIEDNNKIEFGVELVDNLPCYKIFSQKEFEQVALIFDIIQLKKFEQTVAKSQFLNQQQVVRLAVGNNGPGGIISHLCLLLKPNIVVPLLLERVNGIRKIDTQYLSFVVQYLNPRIIEIHQCYINYFRSVFLKIGIECCEISNDDDYEAIEDQIDHYLQSKARMAEDYAFVIDKGGYTASKDLIDTICGTNPELMFEPQKQALQIKNNQIHEKEDQVNIQFEQLGEKELEINNLEMKMKESTIENKFAVDEPQEEFSRKMEIKPIASNSEFTTTEKQTDDYMNEFPSKVKVFLMFSHDSQDFFQNCHRKQLDGVRVSGTAFLNQIRSFKNNARGKRHGKKISDKELIELYNHLVQYIGPRKEEFDRMSHEILRFGTMQTKIDCAYKEHLKTQEVKTLELARLLRIQGFNINLGEQE